MGHLCADGVEKCVKKLFFIHFQANIFLGNEQLKKGEVIKLYTLGGRPIQIHKNVRKGGNTRKLFDSPTLHYNFSQYHVPSLAVLLKAEFESEALMCGCFIDLAGNLIPK